MMTLDVSSSGVLTLDGVVIDRQDYGRCVRTNAWNQKLTPVYRERFSTMVNGTMVQSVCEVSARLVDKSKNPAQIRANAARRVLQDMSDKIKGILKRGK